MSKYSTQHPVLTSKHVLPVYEDGKTKASEINGSRHSPKAIINSLEKELN
jgi:hypothetical protein